MTCATLMKVTVMAMCAVPLVSSQMVGGCAPGTYSTESGATNSSTCLTCSPGKYSAFSGASSCLQCGTGKYTTSNGATSPSDCLLCGTCFLPGQYNTCGNDTAGYCSMCTNTALPRQYFAFTRGTIVSYNPICPLKIAPPGYYRNCTDPRAPMWIVAPPGAAYAEWCSFQGSVHNQPYFFCEKPGIRMYLWWQLTQWAGSADFSAVGTASFTVASPAFDGSAYADGEYQPIAALITDAFGMQFERPCSSGTYSSSSGLTACDLAPIGSFVPSHTANKYVNCPNGTFSSAEGASACTPCRPGNYRAVQGPYASPVIGCVQASAGYFVPSSGATTQTACVSSTYSPAGASQCTPACPAGTYAASSQCLPTPSGSYSTAGILTPCLPGTYTSMTAATMCSACAAGSYSTAAGSVSSAACAGCASGVYTSATGFSACTACGPGRYNTAAGVTECVSCPIGKFTSANGTANNCGWCTAGVSFASNTGASVCVSCSTSCPLDRQVQGPCTTTSNTFCGFCTPVTNCNFMPGASCGNSTHPNCVCMPGFEMAMGKCQQCRQGFFKSVNSTLPCSQWTLARACPANYFQSNGTRFSDTICLPCPNPPGNATITGAFCEWGCKAGFNTTQLR